MASLTFAVDDGFNKKLSNFRWINLSELVRERLIERKKQAELLLMRLESKEEKELIRWSVDLGRRAKKGRFEQLLNEVSPETKEKLLKKLSAKREKLLK